MISCFVLLTYYYSVQVDPEKTALELVYNKSVCVSVYRYVCVYLFVGCGSSDII